MSLYVTGFTRTLNHKQPARTKVALQIEQQHNNDDGWVVVVILSRRFYWIMKVVFQFESIWGVVMKCTSINQLAMQSNQTHYLAQYAVKWLIAANRRAHSSSSYPSRFARLVNCHNATKMIISCTSSWNLPLNRIKAQEFVHRAHC